MHAELQELADTFSANRIVTGRAIRKLKESDPGGFHKAVILVLRESTEGPGTTYLLAMLLTRPEGLESICDPAIFTPAQSVALVRQARTLDPQVEVKLANLVAKLPLETDRQASLGTRVLEVLEQSTDPGTVLPALRQLLGCPHPRIRSKVALLIGRITRNPQWARLGDPGDDQRIKGNAIESLWGLNTPAAKEAFRDALLDARHRVAANAAIGLYLAGDLEGAAALFGFSRSARALFRAAAAWCMGRTADPRFLPRLTKLSEDPELSVRKAALRSVDLVNQRIEHCKGAGTLPLQINSLRYDQGVHHLQVLAGDGGPEMRGFGAVSFVVSVANEVVERFTLEELNRIPPVTYHLAFPAPPAEPPSIKVELYCERGAGEVTGTGPAL